MITESWTSVPLIESYVFFAKLRYYRLDIVDAKVSKDRGVWRIDCIYEGEKENVIKMTRPGSGNMEFYMNEIADIIKNREAEG